MLADSTTTNTTVPKPSSPSKLPSGTSEYHSWGHLLPPWTQTGLLQPVPNLGCQIWQAAPGAGRGQAWVMLHWVKIDCGCRVTIPAFPSPSQGAGEGASGRNVLSSGGYKSGQDARLDLPRWVCLKRKTVKSVPSFPATPLKPMNLGLFFQQ